MRSLTTSVLAWFRRLSARLRGRTPTPQTGTTPRAGVLAPAFTQAPQSTMPGGSTADGPFYPMKPRDGSTGDPSQSSDPSASDMPATAIAPDIAFQIVACPSEADAKLIVSEIRGVLNTYQERQPDLLPCPYLDTICEAGTLFVGVFKLGIWRDVSDYAANGQKPFQAPVVVSDPELFRQGLVRLPLLPGLSTVADFGIQLAPTFLSAMANIAQKHIPERIAVGQDSNDGFVSLNFWQGRVPTNQIVTKITGDLHLPNLGTIDTDAIELTVTDTLSAITNRDDDPAHFEQLVCKSLQTFTMDKTVSFLTSIEVWTGLLPLSWSALLPGPIGAFLGEKYAPGLPPVPTLPSFGAVLVRLLPIQFLTAATTKVVFAYRDVQVDSQTGVVATGTIKQRVPRTTGIWILGPQAIDHVPAQHGPTITASYYVETADLRAPLSFAWTATSQVMQGNGTLETVHDQIGSPTTQTTDIAFDLRRTPIYRSRTVGVTVTDADNVELKTSIDVVISYVERQSKHAVDPDNN